MDVDWYDKDSVIRYCKSLNESHRAFNCVIKISGQATYSMLSFPIRGPLNTQYTVVYDPLED